MLFLGATVFSMLDQALMRPPLSGLGSFDGVSQAFNIWLLGFILKDFPNKIQEKTFKYHTFPLLWGMKRLRRRTVWLGQNVPLYKQCWTCLKPQGRSCSILLASLAGKVPWLIFNILFKDIFQMQCSDIKLATYFPKIVCNICWFDWSLWSKFEVAHWRMTAWWVKKYFRGSNLSRRPPKVHHGLAGAKWPMHLFA